MSDKKTILVVDDDQKLREVLGFRLESAGYEILYAKGGKEAIALAEKKQPDLVILDVVLPDVTGYGVSMYLREHAKTHHIPIIMISGIKRDMEDVRLAEETGISYYVNKPYNPVQLLEKVDAALQVGTRGRVSDQRKSQTGSKNDERKSA